MIRASKRTRQRRRSVALLDADARERVFSRDGRQCVRCGRTKGIQWAHIFSRRYKHMRWDEWNALTLCAGCHLWWHHEPILAVDWFKKTFGTRYDYLIGLRNDDRRVNVRELAEALK